ncbi:hypothetical protein Syun_019553 [Stephania yunnanensis]|uniref:Reverse transcriptase zinc-binding domain-containing protein n=1 Tax=Stephania yunnanensis TaxID=152371 RepID=A0AAP0IWQ1_9MAGN
MTITEFAALFEWLQGIVISPHIDNERIWEWEVSKLFSAKSAFFGLCLDLSPLSSCRVYDLIWKSCTSMKVRVFVWLAWLGRINTTDVLQRRCPNHTLLNGMNRIGLEVPHRNSLRMSQDNGMKCGSQKSDT